MIYVAAIFVWKLKQLDLFFLIMQQVDCLTSRWRKVFLRIANIYSEQLNSSRSPLSIYFLLKSNALCKRGTNPASVTFSAVLARCSPVLTLTSLRSPCWVMKRVS